MEQTSSSNSPRDSILKIVQINLQKSIAATSSFCQLMDNHHVALVQEPYAIQNKIAGLRNCFHTVCSSSGKPLAGIIINLPDVAICHHTDVSTNCIVCIEMQTNVSNIVLVSVYRPFSEELAPTVIQLKKIVDKFRGKRIIIGGDFNVHSSVWGDPNDDADADDILELMHEEDLFLLNDPNSAPTFSGPRGQSWIDLTICNGPILPFIHNWQVSDEDSLGDHSVILYEIHSSRTRSESKRGFALAKADWGGISDDLAQATECFHLEAASSREEAIEWCDKIIASINSILNARIPKKSGDSRSEPWWNQDLTFLRRNNNRLRRQYQTARDPDSRAHKKQVYLNFQAHYKNKIKQYKLA